MRLLYLTPGFGLGGLERKIATYLKIFLNAKYDVAVCLNSNSGYMQELVPLGTEIFALKGNNYFTNMLQFREVLNDYMPNVIVSQHTGLYNIGLLLIAKIARKKMRVIIGIDNTVSEKWKWSNRDTVYRRISKWIGRRLVIPYFYPRADRLVVVSNGIRDDLVSNYGITSDKIDVIYNPIDVESIVAAAKLPLEESWLYEEVRPIILGVGRLVKEKGFDNLIRAVGNILRQREVLLIIIGRGDQQERLQNLIVSLNLGKSVILLGAKDNPFPYYKRASVFALSSEYEGFGLVLVEALALNCQVVSTDCRSGPAEILEEGKWGRLVPVNDIEALAEGIISAIDQPIMQGRLASRAEDFSLERAGNQFINLVERLYVTI